MVRVEITEKLYEEIEKKFKEEAGKIIDLLMSLKQSPSKGKILGVASGLTIKELKYKSFRFYLSFRISNNTSLYTIKIYDILP